MEVLTLSGKGLAVALVMGLFFVLFGWHQVWWLFILGMVLFLLLSALVTRVGRDYKRKKGFGQDPRGVPNVVANGAVPLALAGLYRMAMVMGAEKYAALCLFGFVASVAAITADKFASEIGVLDGIPISLLGRKAVRKGVSGGVTWVGLLVSAAAPAIVAVVLIPLSIHIAYGGLTINPYLAVAIVVLCGFIGSLVDSVLGYYEEMSLGNKFTSNLACSLVGALIGILLLSLL